MTRLAAVGLLLATVTGAGVEGAAAQGPRLYVTNQDDATVSVVDIGTLTVAATLDLQPLGFGATAKPHHAQVEPDGSAWYLTTIGAGRVLKLDRDNRIIGSVETEVPGLLTLVPGKDLLIVARSMSAVNPPARILLIRRSDMSVVDEIGTFFPRPHALVAHPGGEYVYVASLGVNQLAAIRLADGEVNLQDVEGPPHTFTQFAVSPDGRWLAATASTSNQLAIFDLSDPFRPTLARMIPMAAGPFEPVFTWDGRQVFVTNLDANRVTVVDVAGWTVAAIIEHAEFHQPHGVALSADGRWLFVSNRYQGGGAHDHEGQKAMGHGKLMAICIPTRTVEAVLPVGNYAAGMGVAAPARAPSTPSACR